MEAMACGLPVVATDAGAVNELVEDILVTEQSSLELANAIRTLIHNPALRREQGKRNRSIVMKKHNRNNFDKFAAALIAAQK
jgi:glycosyltransferase involved in cell wall biosynthesis